MGRALQMEGTQEEKHTVSRVGKVEGEDEMPHQNRSLSDKLKREAGPAREVEEGTA